MKTAKYIRVSTTEQNIARQRDKRYKNYVDKCSGSIPFDERPEASKLIDDVLNKKIEHIVVHSISRLGRSTIDILKTIEYFTKLGVCIEAEKEGFRTLDRNKRENATAKMVISIMATLSQWELEMASERRLEGIAKAKERGAYSANGGRKADNPAEWITKPKQVKIIKRLNAGQSIRDIAFREDCSVGLVQKTKKQAIELGMMGGLDSKEEKLNEYLQRAEKLVNELEE